MSPPLIRFLIDELELIWYAGTPEEFRDQIRHIPL